MAPAGKIFDDSKPYLLYPNCGLAMEIDSSLHELLMKIIEIPHRQMWYQQNEQKLKCFVVGLAESQAYPPIRIVARLAETGQLVEANPEELLFGEVS